MQKHVEAVEHRTFSGAFAVESGHDILFVPERCVLELKRERARS